MNSKRAYLRDPQVPMPNPSMETNLLMRAHQEIMVSIAKFNDFLPSSNGPSVAIGLDSQGGTWYTP